MKKIKKTKLDLSKETVRVLAASELTEAHGGYSGTACFTGGCTSSEPTCRSYAVCTQLSRQIVGC